MGCKKFAWGCGRGDCSTAALPKDMTYGQWKSEVV